MGILVLVVISCTPVTMSTVKNSSFTPVRSFVVVFGTVKAAAPNRITAVALSQTSDSMGDEIGLDKSTKNFNRTNTGVSRALMFETPGQVVESQNLQTSLTDRLEQSKRVLLITYPRDEALRRFAQEKEEAYR